jgi:ADP-heptose:LPS heptosyltransferase
MQLEKAQKIGIIEPMNLGDLLCSVPLFRCLRHAWPEAEIVLIGDPPVSPFYDHFRHYLDRLILSDEDIEWGTDEELAGFVKSMRAERFDLLLKIYFWAGIKPENSYWDEHYRTADTDAKARISENAYRQAHERSIRLACSLDARCVVGLAEPWATRPLSFIGVPFRRDQHIVYTLLDVARALGIPTGSPHLEFPLSRTDRQLARDLLNRLGLSDDHPLIGLHPGASVIYRRWPPERFARVADFLVEAYNANIVLMGMEAEKPVVAQVVSAMRHADRAIDISGVTSLGSLAAVIDRLVLLLSNPTGPIHLAVARQRPSIVVFGLETDAIQWGELDPKIQRALLAPAGGQGMSHMDAIQAVTVEQAITATREMLDINQRDER